MKKGLDKELKLWYDEPAIDDDKGSTVGVSVEKERVSATNLWARKHENLKGWEEQALALGNGYMGAKVFGGVEHERIQLTENSLLTPKWGVSNFAETYIDFDYGADFDESKLGNDYIRDLDLRTAVSTVSYTYDGVKYTREMFTSYPAKVMVIRLTSEEEGKLSFTLRPTIPYLGEYGGFTKEQVNADKTSNESSYATLGRTGTVIAEKNGDKNTVTVSGTMTGFGVDYEGIYQVVPEGGSVTVSNTTNADGETDGGTVTVKGATSAVIYIAIGTNYPISGDEKTGAKIEPWAFDNARREAGAPAAKAKMDTMPDPHSKVLERLEGAVLKCYEDLKAEHIADYKKYFDRTDIDLGGVNPGYTTDELVGAYDSEWKTHQYNGLNGTAGRKGCEEYNHYLEELMFHFGRYMLIASSREGALPPNLSGVWNRYRLALCNAGYWHNINQQMNYSLTFVSNLSELFECYMDFYEAMAPKLYKDSSAVIKSQNPDNYSEDPDNIGKNGWNMCTGIEAFYGYAIVGNQVDGNATGAWTAEMFWDYYTFTGDMNVLERIYPVVYGSANYMSRLVVKQEDGTYITKVSGSPEQTLVTETSGSGFDQQGAHDIITYALKATEILGEKRAKDLLADGIEFAKDIDRMKTVVDHLDPIIIGESGQIKEFREEKYYADLGEKNHRHISHLIGTYPGTTVNNDTPAWKDAVKRTLELVGYGGCDIWEWPAKVIQHSLTWARVGDAESAYNWMQRHLDLAVMNNLWSECRCIQVEGNFGATAHAAEMLLQSHNERIEPLAALPLAWKSGAYRGLIARGGFEISAEWSDGKLTKVAVLSNQGNTAKLHYPGIATGELTVTASDASAIAVTITGEDDISFDTIKGVTYTVSGFTAAEKVTAPTDVTPTEKNGIVTLKWNESADASSYNVYVAEGSSPDYTLVAGNITTCGYTFEKARDAGQRYTYAVTATDKTGRESDRACAFVSSKNV